MKTKNKPSNIIELLHALDPHKTYPNKAIIEDLCWVDLDAAMWGTHAIRVGDILIWEANADCGPIGIWPLHLVGALFPMLTGRKLINNKYGRGEWYADVLQQLEKCIQPQHQ